MPLHKIVLNNSGWLHFTSYIQYFTGYTNAFALKLNLNILYFAGLISCSFLIGIVLFFSYQSDNLFAIFFYAALSFLWLCCFYNIIKKEWKNASWKIAVVKYWQTIVSVLTLVPIICIFTYYEQKLNLPSLIKAQRHGVYADFKTDGSYVIKSGAWASKSHFYGTYTLQDSILEIDRSDLDDVLTSNRFLLKYADPAAEKRRPQYDKIDTEKYLVQIDKDGNEIIARKVGGESLPYKFEVVFEKRK